MKTGFHGFAAPHCGEACLAGYLVIDPEACLLSLKTQGRASRGLWVGVDGEVKPRRSAKWHSPIHMQRS